LGLKFDYLVFDISDKTKAYEFTNVIGTWARSNGYKGIIAPGARGQKDYKNIIIFNQSDLDVALEKAILLKIK